MRIEYVTSVRLHEVSAPSHHVLGVSRAFRMAGYDVTLICPVPGIPAEYPAAQTGQVIQFPFYEGKVGWWLFHAFLAARLRAAALTGRLADLYYFRLSPCFLVSGSIKSLQRPTALELNGLDYLSLPGAANMLREFDFIMVGSDEMKRAVHHAFPTLPGQVIVQSNIGIDAVRVNSIEWSVARAETGLPPGAFVALILSGFWSYHDFETAWTALAAVAGRRPVILLIAGSGEQQTAVKAACLKWADRLDVRFLGPITGRCLSLYTSAADVCINLISRDRLSSEGNGKGQKTIDYLAHGRPVIESITDRLPVPEWLRNHTFPVNAGDSIAVADALIWIMDHRDAANAIAAAGRNYVMAEFTWSRVIGDFLSRPGSRQPEPRQPDTAA
jgi:glycosyltransferase involved in cell wall biosynthesis